MSTGRGGGSGKSAPSGGPKKEFPPANSSYRDVSTSMVIKTDRSEIVRRDKEAGSDAVESIWGRVNISEMGSRAGRESVPKSDDKNLKILGLGSNLNKTKKNTTLSYDFDNEFELKYRPKSRETRTAYEHILTFLQQVGDFSDQPASILKSATDEVLSILKSSEESWKDLDRKLKIEQSLGIKSEEFSSEKYAQLVNLGRRITDYSIENDEGKESMSFENGQGVAVLFDDEEVDEEAEAEAEEDFGIVSNLIGEEEEDEDEAELEKTLPPIARLSQRTITTNNEEKLKLLDLETLAFPEGIIIINLYLV